MCGRSKNSFIRTYLALFGTVIACLMLLFSFFKCNILLPLQGEGEFRISKETGRSRAGFEEEGVWWRKLLCEGKSHQEPEESEQQIVLQQVFSWARQNPKMKVWYVLTSETADDTDGLPSRLLQRYKNLQVVGADLDGIFAGTPAKEFFLSGNWAKNINTADGHLSDMMRTAIIWHWGGFYSDTDMMCLRDMTCFRNAIGFEKADSINCAFFHLKDHEQYLRKIMEEMGESHDPAVWKCIGPDLYTRIMKRQCEASNVRLEYQEKPQSCINITIYPVDTFYPILYVDYLQYFQIGMGRNILKEFEGSSLFHFWNKASKNYAVRVGGGSIYDKAAKTFCPISYEDAYRRSKFF